MTSVVSTYWKDELHEPSHLGANKSDNHKNRTQRKGELSASHMNTQAAAFDSLLTFRIPANLTRAN